MSYFRIITNLYKWCPFSPVQLAKKIMQYIICKKFCTKDFCAETSATISRIIPQSPLISISHPNEVFIHIIIFFFCFNLQTVHFVRKCFRQKNIFIKLFTTLVLINFLVSVIGKEIETKIDTIFMKKILWWNLCHILTVIYFLFESSEF